MEENFKSFISKSLGFWVDFQELVKKMFANPSPDASATKTSVKSCTCWSTPRFPKLHFFRVLLRKTQVSISCASDAKEQDHHFFEFICFFFRWKCLLKKGRAEHGFFQWFFYVFSPCRNVETFSHAFFWRSTFSRSKRQSKKRSRARQSDARSSVGPEDCQRRVKPWSFYILFFFSISSKSKVVNLSIFLKSGINVYVVLYSNHFFNKFELVWLGLSPCHGCKISWAGHDRACTPSLAEQPRWWRRGTLRRCVLMIHSCSLSLDGKNARILWVIFGFNYWKELRKHFESTKGFRLYIYR